MPDRTVLDAYAARIIAALRRSVSPGRSGAHANVGSLPIDTLLEETELPLEEGAQGELLRDGSFTGPRGTWIANVARTTTCASVNRNASVWRARFDTASPSGG